MYSSHFLLLDGTALRLMQQIVSDHTHGRYCEVYALMVSSDNSRREKQAAVWDEIMRTWAVQASATVYPGKRRQKNSMADINNQNIQESIQALVQVSVLPLTK